MAPFAAGGCSKQDGGATIVADDVAPEESEVAPTSPLARDGRDGFEGYGRDIYGYCRLTISTKSENAALQEFEAGLGIRIDRYFPFADGIIVEFRNGFRTAIWKKEIDCKDPPYDPFPKQDETSDPDQTLPEPIEAQPQADPGEIASPATEPAVAEPTNTE